MLERCLLSDKISDLITLPLVCILPSSNEKQIYQQDQFNILNPPFSIKTTSYLPDPHLDLFPQTINRLS